MKTTTPSTVEPPARRRGLSTRLFARTLLFVWLTGLCTTVHATPSFTEQAEFGTGSTISIAWADADLDGDLDLAVGNYFNEQNLLFFNNGNGSFTQENRFGKRNTFALVWGDYDNDGDPDMAIGNRAQGNRLITGNGDGTFSGANQFGTHVTIALAWADYDNDGDLDMAVGNGILGTVEQNYLYRNDGGGSFVAQAQFGTGQTASLAWGDCDGDGDLDLAVGNGGFGSVGQNYLYRNNGDGSFTEVPLFGMGDTTCLDWGDCDNDGDLDLAVANWSDAQNLLCRNDGGGTFGELAAFGMRDPNTMAWGDFDNDGDLDLAVGNGDFNSADQNYLYVNDGNGAFTESAQFGLGSTDAVAWGDYDGDGDLDLAVGNEHTTTQNYLYFNNENDADALLMHLVGHFHDLGSGYSNRDAIGARVSAYEAGFLGNSAHLLGFREVGAHGGFAAQSAIDVHFGFPGRTSVDVRIVWPGSGGSSITQDLVGVPVGGRYTIHEGTSGTPAPEIEAASNLFGWRVAPNPMRSGALIELLTESLRPRELEVFDSRGRRVRVLNASVAAGRGLRARWDGHDQGGAPVSAGVYFVRAKGGVLGPAGRVIVVR